MFPCGAREQSRWREDLREEFERIWRFPEEPPDSHNQVVSLD